ncbi:hypothetical protein UlMin_037013 [Ulmus minor]
MDILSIPVGSLEHEDTLIWHYTRDGEYSVKSGYKSTLILNDVVECSNPQVVNKWWKSLWQLKIPPKVRNFTWRLCKGWLPSASKVHKQGYRSTSLQLVGVLSSLSYDFLHFEDE